jgi:ankyrin repeat protein
MRLNNLGIAKLLIKAGAKVNQQLDDSTSRGEQEGNTILMETIYWYSLFKDASAIELLLANGANPNDNNSLPYDEYCDKTTSGKCTWRGYTVLTFAAKHGWDEVVKLLLRYGADSSIPRNDGKEAYEIAKEYKHFSTANIIKKYKVQRH